MRALAGVVGPLLLLAGCGYQLRSHEINLPGDVRSISIGTIANQSRRFGIEKRLAFALEREIVRRGTISLAEKPGGGDGVVNGTIRGFQLRPVSFDASDDALQYQLTIAVDLQLTRNSDGKVVWETSDLRETEEYAATARVVVTSSSQFQREALNPGDLNQLTDVQLAEYQERQAVQRLLQNLARSAYALMADDF